MGQVAGGRAIGSAALLLLGAGSGVRLGRPLPKALVEVAGPSLLAHALAAAAGAQLISEVVITAPADQLEQFNQVLADATAVAAFVPGTRLRLVAGGVARSDSVAVALPELTPEVDLVLVHDVARAFAPAWLIDSVVAALRADPDVAAVVPAVPIPDTVKQIGPGPSDRAPIVATIDRATLRAAQTPQGFRRAALAVATEDVAARRDATDDADLVARCGGQVVAIPGDPTAFKITYPFDLLIAEALCADRRKHEYTPAARPTAPTGD